MFPSGAWIGFWQQEHLGTQRMESFELHFQDGLVSGHGIDIVGRFTFDGEYSEDTGRIEMVKQYLGRHAVHYRGQSNGEGAIIGTWTVTTLVGLHLFEASGPFLIQPDLQAPRADEPIIEIGPRRS